MESDDEGILENEETTQIRRSGRERKPKGWLDYITFNVSMVESTEPMNIQEALEDKNWNDAMKEKYEALLRNETWTLCTPPKDKKILKTKWVFKIKQDSEGKIERYRARLVVKGYEQEAGIDYNDVFVR